MLELLRFIDNPVRLGPIRIPGIVGMRMVLFSVFLLMAILFFREGLVGSREFSWAGLARAATSFGRGKKRAG
jgi:branched-chain amino acid transport system permease protein